MFGAHPLEATAERSVEGEVEVEVEVAVAVEGRGSRVEVGPVLAGSLRRPA